jgi:pimeloyl-ACP methyl ester carboxylesterase
MDTDVPADAYRTRPDPFVTERGDGPPILFAHGTLMDRTMFAPQMAALTPEYRAAAFDFRARTEFWAGPYDLDDLVADTLGVADGLWMDTPVLAGMSMGGFTALRYALQHPDRLSGLILIDAAAEAHDEADREQYRAMVEDLPDAERVSRGLAEASAHFLFGETTTERNPNLVERWVSRWETYVPEAVHHEVHSWLDRPGVADRLDEIDVPTLVVHGEEDRSLPIEGAERMAEAIPDADLARISEAGHTSTLENPNAVSEAIEGFLERVYDE